LLPFERETEYVVGVPSLTVDGPLIDNVGATG